jgi:hypothetical protein
MIILNRQDRTDKHGPRASARRVLICSLFILLSPSLWGQTDVRQDPQAGPLEQAQADLVSTVQGAGEMAPAVAAEPVIVTLPTTRQMALALASPGLREPALLDLAVAAHVVSQVEEEVRNGTKLDHAAIAQGYLDDRAWLQSIVDRYGWVRPQASIFDPAAWQLFDELQQFDLENLPLLIPGHLPKEVLLYQVFQRTSLQLAVANLPNLLLEVEPDVYTLWDAFLRLTEVDGVPDAAWKAVENTWSADRQLPPQLQADAAAADREIREENLPQAVSRVARSAVDASPPDSEGLKWLRYTLYHALAAPPADEITLDRNQAKDSLYLVSIIDGLHDGRYIAFVQGLLAVTSRLLEAPADVQESFSLVDWLVGELPALSAHYAAHFAAVDPRLNSAVTASYDVLVQIAGFRGAEDAGQAGAAPESAAETAAGETVEGPADAAAVTEADEHQQQIRAARRVLADAVAQIALLIPDMAYYFDMPVRAKIVNEIDNCLGKTANNLDNGSATMNRGDFDRCMETLLRLADTETRVAELSGDMNGPFTPETLRRELGVVPWQRINYGVGYLEERFSSGCLPPANVLPNPLEWSILANVMSWLAEHSPEFFETTENENRIARMRSIGEEIIQAMVEQTECLAASGSVFNDLISRSMIDYEIVLRDLDSGISQAEADFRAQKLKPGADVALDKDALQKTSYRPGDFVISPCDPQAVCEMSGNLSVTRALIGLFPSEYLVAEQTGMGHIEICYRNMEWVQRRSELVRADDENVANYFGHLAFDLVGRYVENGDDTDIFGFRFTSPEESHYLFAQSSQEVLDDSCPVEWVGSRMVTPLREDRYGIVPNRLTYLAAARKLPSRLLQNNWDRGAEWRDWFVTGIGVTALDIPPAPDITTRLNQHLQALYQAEQLEIYQRLLLAGYRNPQGREVSLHTEMSEVSMGKEMLRMQMMLFYPESLQANDSIRTGIVGDEGLLDQRTLRRFRENNVAMTSVNRISRERLDRFREVWSQQPEAVRHQASMPDSLVYALTRINMLYRQFFITRPETLQEIEVTEQPVAEDS